MDPTKDDAPTVSIRRARLAVTGYVRDLVDIVSAPGGTSDEQLLTLVTLLKLEAALTDHTESQLTAWWRRPAGAVLAEWQARSAAFFTVVQDEFRVPGTWSFSLSSADQQPSTADDGFDDPTAAAALTLRRVQAQRFLIRRDRWDAESVQLSLGHLSELGSFVSAVLENRLPWQADRQALHQFRVANKQLLASLSQCYARLQGRA